MANKWDYFSDEENNNQNRASKSEPRQRSASTISRNPEHSLNDVSPENSFRSSVQRKRNNQQNKNPDPCSCIGIFGLSKKTEESTLKDIFQKYGNIISANLIMDKNRNESLGFAFIKYEDLESAAKAIEATNGIPVDGKNIRVDYSITQKAHTPTPGQYKGNISGRQNYNSEGNRNKMRNNQYDRKIEYNRRDDFDEKEYNSRSSERDNRYNGRDNRFNERNSRHNEKNSRYNERDNRYNDRDDRYNDRDDRYNDRGDRYNDRGDRYNDRGDRYNDRDNVYNDRGSRHNERESRYNDRDSRYIDRDNRYNERNSRCNERDERPNDRCSRFDEKESRNNRHSIENKYRVESYKNESRYSDRKSQMFEKDFQKRNRSGNRYSPSCTIHKRTTERDIRSREPGNRFVEKVNQFSEKNFQMYKKDDEYDFPERRLSEKDRFNNRNNHSNRQRSRSPVFRRNSPNEKSYENFRSRKY